MTTGKPLPVNVTFEKPWSRDRGDNTLQVLENFGNPMIGDHFRTH
jgi:hypothetical protein